MVYTTPTNHTPLINHNTWYLEILIRKGLGVHGEKRCRARIILILALAKWQVERGSVFAIIKFWEGLFA